MPLGRGWTPYESVPSTRSCSMSTRRRPRSYCVRAVTHRLDRPTACSPGLINAAEVENARSRISTHTLLLLFNAQANAQTNSWPGSRQDDSRTYRKSIVGAPILRRFVRRPVLSTRPKPPSPRGFRRLRGRRIGGHPGRNIGTSAFRAADCRGCRWTTPDRAGQRRRPELSWPPVRQGGPGGISAPRGLQRRFQALGRSDCPARR